MIIIFYIPIAGILIIIYLVIFPYTSISYVIEDIPLKELYHYNLKITPKNRMKIYLPVIILNLISYICTNILSKFLPFTINFVFSTISSTLIVIFLMITGSIIYLNVKYIRLEDENDKSQNNDNNDELKIIE